MLPAGNWFFSPNRGTMDGLSLSVLRVEIISHVLAYEYLSFCCPVATSLLKAFCLGIVGSSKGAVAAVVVRSGVAFVSINRGPTRRKEYASRIWIFSYQLYYCLSSTINTTVVVLKYVSVPSMRHRVFCYLSTNDSLLSCCTPASAAGPSSDTRPGFRAYEPPGRGGWTLGRPTGEDQSARRRGKG